MFSLIWFFVFNLCFFITVCNANWPSNELQNDRNSSFLHQFASTRYVALHSLNLWAELKGNFLSTKVVSLIYKKRIMFWTKAHRGDKMSTNLFMVLNCGHTGKLRYVQAMLYYFKLKFKIFEDHLMMSMKLKDCPQATFPTRSTLVPSLVPGTSVPMLVWFFPRILLYFS